jgi:hypothetical protein
MARKEMNINIILNVLRVNEDTVTCPVKCEI